MMLRIISVTAIMALGACANTGVGLRSAGLAATYDQTLSRHGYDRLRTENPACDNHNHFDNCEFQTEVRDHVSKR